MKIRYQSLDKQHSQTLQEMKKYKEHSSNKETNQELPTNKEPLSDDTIQLKGIEAKFESKYRTMEAEHGEKEQKFQSELKVEMEKHSMLLNQKQNEIEKQREKLEENE